MKEELHELCNIGIFTNSKFNLEQLIYLDNIISDIVFVLNKYKETGIFVKLSHKSAKNDFKLYPAQTIFEVFDNLVHSKEIQSNIPNSLGLILKPWG